MDATQNIPNGAGDNDTSTDAPDTASGGGPTESDPTPTEESDGTPVENPSGG